MVNVPLVEHGSLVAIFFIHYDQPHAWAEEDVAFVRSVADRTRAGIARARAEEQQRFLNDELSHRLKNTLAMVLSIATQTLRSVPDQEPVEAFERRIHTLSSAHDILLQENWSSAPIGAVAKAVLANFAEGGRLYLSGPKISLGPRATLSLSLLLHELATNAAKYGALSNDEGQVEVAWRIDETTAGPDVILNWTEKGGPPVRSPGRRGFGSRLIRMGMVGTGGVDLQYPETGFKAVLRAPLAQVQQS